MASSNPNGWVKFYFDPPYDIPRSERPSKHLMDEWLRSVRSDLYYPNKLTLNTPDLVVYDSRREPGDNTGRIIIAVRLV